MGPVPLSDSRKTRGRKGYLMHFGQAICGGDSDQSSGRKVVIFIILAGEWFRGDSNQQCSVL